MQKSLILFIFLSFIVLPLKSQKLQPYGHDLPFLNISEKKLLPHIDSLKILLVEFNTNDISSFKKTLINNPQLVEIQMKNPPLKAIQIVSKFKPEGLINLFIHDYKASRLEVPKFSNIKLFQINSDQLESISMLESAFDSLNILGIRCSNLKEWKASSTFPSLSLIDLNAPSLSEFPIKRMPQIYQFSFNCSFNTLPQYLCECIDLTHISFTNNKTIEIDKCFEEKVKKAYYSNLTLYDGKKGTNVLEILSESPPREE